MKRKTPSSKKEKAYLKYRSNKVVENNLKISQIKREYYKSFSIEMHHHLYGGQIKICNLLETRKKNQHNC